MVLLECPAEEPRIAFAQVLVNGACAALLPFEEEQLERDALTMDSASASWISCQAQTTLLLEHLLTFRPHLTQNWRRFGQYFYVFGLFSALSSNARQYLLDRRLIYILADMYMGEDSPARQQQSKAQKKKNKMGDRFEQPNFYHLLDALANLVCACAPRQPVRREEERRRVEKRREDEKRREREREEKREEENRRGEKKRRERREEEERRDREEKRICCQE